MTRTTLYAGVALAALIAGAPGAFAQVAVDQTTLQNDGNVTNNGTIATR